MAPGVPALEQRNHDHTTQETGLCCKALMIIRRPEEKVEMLDVYIELERKRPENLDTQAGRHWSLS